MHGNNVVKYAILSYNHHASSECWSLSLVWSIGNIGWWVWIVIFEWWWSHHQIGSHRLRVGVEPISGEANPTGLWSGILSHHQIRYIISEWGWNPWAERWTQQGSDVGVLTHLQIKFVISKWGWNPSLRVIALTPRALGRALITFQIFWSLSMMSPKEDKPLVILVN